LYRLIVYIFLCDIRSGAHFATLLLLTSHSQCLNSGKLLDVGCCEWLWSIGTWSNRTFP